MSWRERAKEAVGKNSRGTAPTKPTKPSSVSSVSSAPATSEDYTRADLTELDRLLLEMAEIEGWTPAELGDLQDERRRMAPCNVRKALAALRIARDGALAPWPEKPAKRAQITLCELTSRRKEFAVLQGGKLTPDDQAKRADAGREAA